MARVGIVICNYNKAEMVQQCIQAVLENTYRDYDLYIVDNGSSDESAALIRSNYIGRDYGSRHLTLLENKENLGGSGGFDTGLLEAQKHGYEYYMCIDNDALLDEHAIETLVQFLDEHPECGIAASKIYHLEEPDYVQNYGQEIDFEYFCTEVDYLNHIEDGTMPPYVYTDSVPACSLMVRASVCEKIGFLPTENFLYWDDTEWCLLCNRAGYKVASVGASQALHMMGAKKEEVNTFPTYYAWRNWISFFIKYTPEEKIGRLIDTILSSVFQTEFEGRWKKENKHAITIFSAFEDAIYGVTGKAGRDRIFAVDRNENLYEELFSGKQDMIMIENDFPKFTEKITETADRYGCRLIRMTDEEAADIDEPKLFVCESIFTAGWLDHELCEGLKEDYIVDLNDCYVALKDYEKMMQQYREEKEMFDYMQRPLVSAQIKAQREKNTGNP